MYQNISSSVKFFWQKRKKTAYTAPISSAAAPHFIIQPIPLISRSACAIVFGNMMYQRKASIVFRSFAGQKEKSDHLSGSQLWGIWDKSLTQKKRPIPHSKILITKQLHFLKSISLNSIFPDSTLHLIQPSGNSYYKRYKKSHWKPGQNHFQPAVIH